MSLTVVNTVDSNGRYTGVTEIAATNVSDPSHSSELTLAGAVGGPDSCGLLTLPARIVGNSGGRRMAQALRSLVAALPRSGSLVIAGHQQALCETRSWKQLEGLEVIQLPIGDDVDFTLWSQDSFLACTDARGLPVVLLPAHDRRRPDALVVGSMATALGIDVARAEFDFEGGNILVGANVILIGADAIGPDIQSRLAGLGERRAVVSLGTTDRIPDREVRTPRHRSRLNRRRALWSHGSPPATLPPRCIHDICRPSGGWSRSCVRR